MARFFANPKTGEIRVLSKLSDNSFIVFKHINGSVATMKFWVGDVNKTIHNWNTIEYDPSLHQARSLLIEARMFFIVMLQELGIETDVNPFKHEVDRCDSAWARFADILPLCEVFKLRYSMISNAKVEGEK